VADGAPIDLAMAPVDLADQGGKLGLEFAVGADVATRRHRHLQQRNGALPLRPELEHAVERSHSIIEAFRVVQAVNAENQFGALEARSQTRNFGASGGLDRPSGEILDIDTDRESRQMSHSR